MSWIQQRARAMTAYHAATETVTPATAIVMLYDGAVHRLNEAKLAAQERRIEERCIAVGKAHAIIHGLQCQLDFRAGGDIAALLDDYYNYILHRMTQINIKNDPAVCEELISRLREMRASWSTIADGTILEPSSAPANELQRAASAEG
jgi:flagellar protein FliS